MTVSVVFAIAGVIALLFGIVGGGIKAKEVEIPFLNSTARIITVVVGLVLIGITVWLESGKNLPVESGVIQETLPPSATNESIHSQTVVDNSTLTISPTDLPAIMPTSAPTLPSTDEGVEKSFAKLAEAKSWPLVLQDPFDNNDSNWNLWNVDDDQKTETMKIENGVFNWGVTAKQTNVWYYEIAPLSSYSNFYASVKIKRNGFPPEGRNDQANWGLIFRRQGFSFYDFQLNDLQEYSLWLRDDRRATPWTALVGTTKSVLINPGKSNELAIIVDGAEMTLFINGTPVETINDGTFSEGNVGFYVELNYPSSEVMFEFDDFELRQKP